MSRPPRRKSRRRLGIWALRVAAVLVVFGVGLALGQSLDDASPPTETSTSVRTIVPASVSTETITVTVTAP
jgi:hypothetical protein